MWTRDQKWIFKILIITIPIRIHTCFNIVEPDLYSYSKFKVLIVFIIKTTHDVIDFDSLSITQHIHESQKKYDSRTNTILSSMLCICFACCLWCCLSSFFFVNATTTKTVHFDEWYEQLESFLSTYYKYFSKFMNLNE